MKILIFAEVYYPDVMGGGEFSTRQMAEALVRKGHEVVVRCLGKSNFNETINGVRIKRKYINGLSEHFLSNTKNNSISDPFTRFDKIIRKWGDIYPSKKIYEVYRSVIMKEHPDAVHTVSPMTYMGRYNLWKAADDLKLPVSHVCRGPNLLELKFMGGRLDGFNIRRNAKASSYLTALAAPSLHMLKRHNRVGIKGRRFNDVIYNSVDLEPVKLSEEMIRQKEKLILYAGEIKREKGIHTLIKAVEGLTDVKLLLIGSGGAGSGAEDYFTLESGRLKLHKNVREAIDQRLMVLDWMEQEELFKYMRKAKAVILPSEWEEPFGRILVEAIYNGTIAIGSDKGGIPEVLDHNEEYIFRSGDVKALRSRIDRVINMSVSEYLEESAKQQESASGFSEDIFADNWERFFLKQLDL